MEENLTPDWRQVVRDIQARAARGRLHLVLESIVREPVPRVVGDLSSGKARLGTLHCPFCDRQHAAPMERARETYVGVACRDLPAGELRFLLVQAWSPSLDRERAE